MQSSSTIPRLPANPRILCLGNSLKETLSSKLALRSMELGTQLGGGTVSRGFCRSDGGDGFLDAYDGLMPRPIRRQRLVVPDPLGSLTVGEILYDDDSETAVIESAQFIGLALIPPEKRNIMASGTGGLGDAIFSAVNMGAKRIFVGLGGTATCDGGVGMLFHLQEGLKQGTKFTKHITARDLDNPPPVEFDFLSKVFDKIDLRVFCDVTNVLSGPKGTAFNFAAQKGASPSDTRMLDIAIENWGTDVERQTGKSLKNEEGAGAAGGLGFALNAIGGKLYQGSDAFCELIDLQEQLKNCDGVITCEGSFDSTSFAGKAPWRAAHITRLAGKPALIACGLAEDSAIEQANLIGVKVVQFARGVERERRAAEAFTLLQESVRRYVSQRQ